MKLYPIIIIKDFSWYKFFASDNRWGRGQLAQFLGRYVPRQNQKVDPYITTVWHIVISTYQEQKFYGLIKEVPLFSILRKTYPQNFSWVLVNMWVQFLKKKILHVTGLSKIDIL